jgi:NADH dehydrogenase
VIFGDPRGTYEFATQLYREMVATPLPGIGFHTGWSSQEGQVRMSPVHVEDVATAFAEALDDPQTIGKTYVLGGPETLSWTEMLERVASATGRSKLILPMPIKLMRIGATLFDWIPFFPVTRDQLTMLAEGNEVDTDDVETLTHHAPARFDTENLAYLGQ